MEPFGSYTEPHRHAPGPEGYGTSGDPADEPFAAAASQLAAYFAGDLTGFDLPVRLDGTPVPEKGLAGAPGHPAR